MIEPKPVPRPVFRDVDKQAAFAERGYLLDGALAARDIEHFLGRFEQIGRPWAQGAMYSNVHVLDPSVNKEIGAELREALQPIIAERCVDYRVDGGTLLVKGLGAESACEIHQDWNTVDEHHFTALVVWVPLIDVDHENGCLFVAPGSHQPGLFDTIRGANFQNAHLTYDTDLDPYLVEVPMAAGQLCFFAQNLFHGSWPNQTGHPRPALYVGASPSESSLVHYQDLGQDTYGVLAIDEDFYYRGDAGRLAQGQPPDQATVTSEVLYTRGEVSREEFLATMSAHLRGAPDTRRRWLRRRRPAGRT